MTNNFEFYALTKVIFRRDTEQRTGALAREYGAKTVLMVYGGRSAARSGLLDVVKVSLDEAGIRHIELGWFRIPPPR